MTIIEHRTMDIISSCLPRIANALEEQNKMCGTALNGGDDEKIAMIDKACEWLSDHAYSYFIDNHKYGGGGDFDTESLVGDFREAMSKE